MLSGAQLLLFKTIGIAPEDIERVMGMVALIERAAAIDIPAIAAQLRGIDDRLAALEVGWGTSGKDDAIHPTGAAGTGSAAGDRGRDGGETATAGPGYHGVAEAA